LWGIAGKMGDPYFSNEIDFIKGSEGNPGIDDWLIMMPVVAEKKGSWPNKQVLEVPQIPIQKRSKLGERFKVYTTSSHRAVAEYISSTSDRFQPSNGTADDLKNRP